MTRTTAICALLSILLAAPNMAGQEITASKTDPAADLSASVNGPTFVASLLLIKADWSQSPAAKEIEADLRKTLSGETVPADLLKALPSSGATILFPVETALRYSKEHYSELLSWLRSKGLLLHVEAFDNVFGSDPRGDGGELFAVESAVLSKDLEFFGMTATLPVIGQPFIDRKVRLNWAVNKSAVHFAGGRSLTLAEKPRGENRFQNRGVQDRCSFDLPRLLDGQVLIVPAFPSNQDGDFRLGANRKGFEALVAIEQRPPGPTEAAEPRLVLPDKVERLRTEKTSNAALSLNPVPTIAAATEPPSQNALGEKVDPATDVPPLLGPPLLGPPATKPLAEELNPAAGLPYGVPSERYRAGKNVIISFSKAHDTAWGFGESLGKWATQEINPPAPDATGIVADDHLAVWQVGSRYYGYSGKTGRWDVLQLPEGHAPRVIVSNDLARILDGNDLYTFASSTGRWSSPQGKEAAIETPPSDGARVEIYNLRHIRAAATARVINQIFDGSSAVADERTNRVTVRSDATTIALIENLLKTLDAEFAAVQPQKKANAAGQVEQSTVETPPSATNVKVFALRNARATDMARILSQLYGREGASVAVDERTNSLIVSGPAALNDIAFALLTRLDEQLDATSKPPTLASESSATVAERAKQYEAKEQEAASLAQQLRAAKNMDPEGKDVLRAMLQNVVTQSFQLRQKLHEAEVAQLAQRMRGIEQTIQARQRIADQIIDRRVKDLLDPNLQWDAAQSGPQSGPGYPLRGSAPRVDSAAGSAATPVGAGSSSPRPRITYGQWFPEEAEKVWSALGIKVGPLTPDETRDSKSRGGLKITEIVADGPEQRLRVGDIIASLQTQGAPGGMRRAIVEFRRGTETFPVTVEFPSAPPPAAAAQSGPGHPPRGSAPRVDSGTDNATTPGDADLATTIARLEPTLSATTVNPEADKIVWSVLGVKVQTVSRKARANSPVNRGLLIDDVRLDGPAAQLRAGDIIVGLHDWKVWTKSELAWVLLQPVSKNIRFMKPTARSTVEEGTLCFLRNDEPHTIRVVLPPWPRESSTESGAPPAADTASPSPPPPPADLTSARAYRDKLRQRWEALEALYTGGKVRLEDMLQDASDLGEAESAAEPNPGSRHAALKEHVERVKRIKSIVEDKYESQVEPVQNFLAAEAALIKAEAQLAAADQDSTRAVALAYERATAPPANVAPATAFRTAEDFDQRLRDAKAVLDRLQHSPLSRFKQGFAEENDAELMRNKQRMVNDAEQRLSFLREEYAAQLRLLELELQDAESAVAAAGKERDHRKALDEGGRQPPTKLTEAQRAYDAAQLRLERAKTLLDIYRKADLNSSADGSPVEAKAKEKPTSP